MLNPRLIGMPTDLTIENGRIPNDAANEPQPPHHQTSTEQLPEQPEEVMNNEAEKDEISEKISEIFDSFDLHQETDQHLRNPVLRNFEA